MTLKKNCYRANEGIFGIRTADVVRLASTDADANRGVDANF